MDQVFLFTLNGELIVFERRKNKAELARKRKCVVICKHFFPASGQPVHCGASDNSISSSAKVVNEWYERVQGMRQISCVALALKKAGFYRCGVLFYCFVDV